MYDLVVLLHVLGAAVWVGGHLVLALSILPSALKSADVEFLRRFEAAYERVGIPALVIQVLSGLWLVWMLLPDMGAWLTGSTPVSRLILVKFALLAATLALALHARARVIPHLAADRLHILAWHIVPVTGIAVLFAGAGVLYRFGWFN